MNVPPILLPYQQSWLADDSPVKVYSKSRRIGISWAEAGDDTLYAAGTGGDDVWYVGYNQDMAREFVADCAFWARHYQLATSEMEEAVFEAEALEEWEAQLRPIINPLRELIDEADSYEELQAGLEELIGKMDAQRLVQDLGKAFFLSRAAGDAEDTV